MRRETAELLTELKETELLGNVGLPAPLPHRSIASWEEALELCHSEPWGALQLMTSNRNAGLVNELNWGRFQYWNETCEELYPHLAQIGEATFARVAKSRTTTKHLYNSLRWDLLGTLLEREFEDVVAPQFYVPVLLPIYRAGHFPCGWTGPTLDTYWSGSRAPLPAGAVLIH
jgi:hypothetical protein